jgi:hypothetical protein
VQLSILTNLTHLVVDGPADLGLDDAAVEAFASSLTRLETLTLDGQAIYGGRSSDSSRLTHAVLPAIAQVTRLRRLELDFCCSPGGARCECEPTQSIDGPRSSSNEGNTKVERAGVPFTLPELQQLSSLTLLTRLVLSPGHLCKKYQQQFQDSMPSLRQLCIDPM